jgi:hypothetical protein
MTGDLLQSDIDLARRLISDGQTDAEIIVALGYRKIAPGIAQTVVTNLRAGTEVRPDPAPDHLDEAFSNPISPAPSPQDHRTEGIESDSYARTPNPRKEIPWFRFAFLTAIGICLTAIFLVNPKARRAPTTTRSPASTARREPSPSEQRLRVEIEGEAVRVGGIPVTRQNALPALSQLFGAPSRTNQLPELIIYAFDAQGIVLYSEHRAGKDSLLLYFEPVGGANGANHPFRGLLAVQGTAISSNTLSKNLPAIPNLNLSETVANIFSGRCGKLEISFAYLKSPDHLSLVQIDLD